MVTTKVKSLLLLTTLLEIAPPQSIRVTYPTGVTEPNPTVIPKAPNTLNIQMPETVESYNTTPVVRASGVERWDVVRLYSDADCRIEVGSVVASDVTADIPVSYALAPGSYTFCAKTFRGKHASSCSQASASYTIKPLPQQDLQNFGDPAPDPDRWGAFRKNKKWMRQIAKNYWSQLRVEVLTTPLSMIQSALEAKDRKEAATALLFNEFGLVDPFAQGHPATAIDDLEILQVGAYSAKIKFPIITQASWYRVEVMDENLNVGKVLGVHIARPPLHRNHIEYLVAGLAPKQSYVIYVSVLKGPRLFATSLSLMKSHFKTGGQCIPHHPGRGWNEAKYTPVICSPGH